MKHFTKRHLYSSFQSVLLIAALTFLSCSAAWAENPQFHPLESIRENSRIFLQKQMEGKNISADIQIGQLDPRLKLAFCPTELDIFAPYGNIGFGTGTLGVRCHGEQPWTLYVPISILGSGKVVTLNRNLNRGEIITKNDIILQSHDLARLNAGYFTDIDEVIGKQLRRPMMRGGIVMQFHIEEPRLVQRGQEVLILADTSNVAVKMRGTALMDGKEGDRVKVRNLTSRRIIEGVVINANTIKVGI